MSALKRFLMARNLKAKNGHGKHIDAGIVRAVIDRFHFLPYIGMNMKCRVSGKRRIVRGTLQFLGHLHKLPKRNNVVIAGLRLENDENLATDGTFLGKRYFVAPKKRGYFVRFKDCLSQKALH